MTTKTKEARDWLDRIYWRLLMDFESVPRQIPLNQINWQERQFIAKLYRQFPERNYVPKETPSAPEAHKDENQPRENETRTRETSGFQSLEPQQGSLY